MKLNVNFLSCYKKTILCKPGEKPPCTVKIFSTVKQEKPINKCKNNDHLSCSKKISNSPALPYACSYFYCAY